MRSGVGHATSCAIEVFVCAVPDAVMILVAEHWDGWLKKGKPVPLTIRLLRFTAYGNSHFPDFRSVDAAWSLTEYGIVFGFFAVWGPPHFVLDWDVRPLDDLRPQDDSCIDECYRIRQRDREEGD